MGYAILGVSIMFKRLFTFFKSINLTTRTKSLLRGAFVASCRCKISLKFNGINKTLSIRQPEIQKRKAFAFFTILFANGARLSDYSR